MTTNNAMDVVRVYQPGDEAGIHAVMDASLEVDRLPGMSRGDNDRMVARLGADPGGTVVALEGAEIFGYCTPRVDILAVHPDRRRRGHGRRLVAAARQVVAGRGLEHLRLYVPQHIEASVAFARRLGFRYQSSLWLFVLARETPVPPPAFPADVGARPLRNDEDLERYVELMNAAFVGHPSPMSWSVEMIRHVHGLQDFDPANVLILGEAANPESLIGFAAVNVDPDDAPGAGDALVGTVGLIGVVPSWRGRGLGRELVRWAVSSLRRRGAGRIELAVEAENDRATGLYRSHGFVPTIEWPHWVLEATATDA